MCAAAIAFARPKLASTVTRVKERHDAYSLPPTHLLPAASMGYKQALADLIWAHVLVTQGLRYSEKRPFDYLATYLDAIHELDPKFREPYRFADSLLAFQANDPDKVGSVRAARRAVERGVAELPTDAELWVTLGEFLAYIGPSALQDPEEQAKWRADGAAALMHAGQLGAKDENVMWHSVAAVGLLSGQEAEREALIRFLERVYAMTEDEELREHVLKKLHVLGKDQAESMGIRRQRAFDGLWRKVSFINRTQLRVIGPMPETWQCAGDQPEGPQTDRCRRDWLAWGRTLQLGR